MIKLFVIILFFITSIVSYAQADLRSEKLSQEQGVSNDLIYTICQDSKGFLWFGTMFGLVRYDGLNYKTFRYDPLDTNSLSNDDVISIFEDNSGSIWIGTYNGGVNKYDRATGKFTRYLNNKNDKNDKNNSGTISSNTVWSITQDKDSVMWFATEGGGLAKFIEGKFYSYKRDSSANNKSISGNFLRSVAADRDGNIWAGAFETGLNKYDKQKNIFTNYRLDEKNEKSLSNNFVNAIFEDSDGELWIGTGGGGLNKLDKVTGEFKRFMHDSNDVNSISSKNVFSIAEESPGILLIGTQNGLNRFDKASEKFERIKLHNDNDDKNKRETILSFVKDRSGIIWASSYSDGLYKLSHPSEKFKDLLSGKNVRSIYEDMSGRLWAGTTGEGLFMSEDKGKNFDHHFDKQTQISISGSVVNSITEDNAGNIWIGTMNGVNKLDKSDGKFYKYFNDSLNENSPGSNNILKLYSDKAGILWIGTDKGLDRFDPRAERFTHYRHNDSDPNSLSENTILSIYEDKHNELWFGTYAGLNRLNRNSGGFTHFVKDPFDAKSISNNYVFSFCEDRNNNFWIGTGGGLNIFDRNTQTFFHFTEHDGLPNGVIAGIEAGDDDHLWISTYKGISRFNVKEREFKNYDGDDGLLSNMFNSGSYFKNKSGEIFFGGIDGVNYFNSAGIDESKFDPSVVLTSLIKYDDKNKTETDISSLSEIKLNYKDNILNIGFNSLDYSNPKKNKFSYKLEGFDRDWSKSNSTANAVYTNLDPGEYVFKVRGTNSDGIWSSRESSIKLIITPPFWKTWWFYGILICTLLAGIMFVQNYRIRKKVKTLLEIENIRHNERELMREQASKDYHDELGHKLTRISLYSRRINKKLRPSANGLTNDLNSIVETSNSLQSGAKDLIWAMNPQEDSLRDLVVRLKNFGYELFENTGMNFSSNEVSENFTEINLSMKCKRHIVFIFKEGMNNILKYSRCSEVELNFKLIEECLEITLKDNGVGFDPVNCPKGYGLKNIYSRAQQINAVVSISSEKNTGSVIKLRTGNLNLISV
ncbi:MAG: two-component regulator propeller domain-containing protein [Ignavibacteria bacterium]